MKIKKKSISEQKLHFSFTFFSIIFQSLHLISKSFWHISIELDETFEAKINLLGQLFFEIEPF